MSSFFHHRNILRKHKDDYNAFLLYFIYFFGFFFIIPILFIVLFFDSPFDALESLGLQFGDYKLGLILLLIGIPLTVFIVFVSSKDPELKEQYPFSKNACRNPKKFVLYEISYLVFYYSAWEFTFRGVFLFGTLEFVGNNPKGIIFAILLQSILAAVFHLGHPNLEVIGALVGSIVYGLIAYHTKSIFYPLFLHAFIGILNDSFFYRHHHKKERSPIADP
jgi:membrane protease YdiL (CAAX protease family)